MKDILSDILLFILLIGTYALIVIGLILAIVGVLGLLYFPDYAPVFLIYAIVCGLIMLLFIFLLNIIYS